MYKVGSVVKSNKNIGVVRDSDICVILGIPGRVTGYHVSPIRDGKLDEGNAVLYNNEISEIKDKKIILEALKAYREYTNSILDNLDKEIEFREKYDSEEEFLAEQIVEILKIKNDSKAIEAILKTRVTHLL